MNFLFRTFNTDWVQNIVEWLIKLLPYNDLVIVARIVLWSIVLFILIKLYKQVKRK